jgi:hypothetical protein
MHPSGLPLIEPARRSPYAEGMIARGLALSLLAAGLAAAQSSASIGTYTYDVNGRRVLASQSGIAATNGSSANVRTTQSMNGRAVPAESVEEKVVSDGPDGKVVERLVKVYDENGRAVSTEKQVITERKRDGGSEVSTAIYRSDLNGRLALAERAQTVTSGSGAQTTSQTLVERVSLNGGLEPVERQQTTTQKMGERTDSDTVIYRKDSNGSFSTAAREVVSITQSGATTTQNVSQYNTAATGQMELTGQRVVTTTARPDGSQLQVVDVYGMTAPGRAVNGYSEGPKLREQQIIEKNVSSGGGFVETYSIRRPSLDNGALGNPVKISETVCTGNCIPPKPAEPKPAAEPKPNQP